MYASSNSNTETWRLLMIDEATDFTKRPRRGGDI